jgi:hypothetical protein
MVNSWTTETLDTLMQARYRLSDVNMKAEAFIELLKEYAGFFWKENGSWHHQGLGR